MQQPTSRESNETSVLSQLRCIAPPRRALTLPGALRVAELQAERLLTLGWVSTPPIPLAVLELQPRIRIEYDFDMPAAVSGVSDWDYGSQRWIITINGGQPTTRQRFTVLHEYKHILDHGRLALRTDPTRRYWGLPPDEFVADYFAGCTLVPRSLLERAWTCGTRDVASLAQQFDVSERAIEVRLEQAGLTPTQGRCGERVAAMKRRAT